MKIDNEMVEKHLELELQLTQKEVSQTEKLQEERQEVGPSIPVQSGWIYLPTKPTENRKQI